MMEILEPLRCGLIRFPTINDYRGDLTFAEGGSHVPFEIKRVYYIYRVPPGESRGGHAHKKVHQVMISLSGSLDVTLDDGSSRRGITLDTPYLGLYVPNLIWREIDNFSAGTVLLVLASEFYDEDDYIRNYEDFKEMII